MSRNRVKRNVSRFAEDDLAIQSRSLGTVGASKRKLKHATMRESELGEYPQSYAKYDNNKDGLEQAEVVSARCFETPQKKLHFSAAAAAVTGGVQADKEGYLIIRNQGFFKSLTSQKNYVVVRDAQIRILAKEPDDILMDHEIPSLLDIPMVEVRAINLKEGAKDFKVVFNLALETRKTLNYKPHTLWFVTPSPDAAEKWAKAIMYGCINTSLFLNSSIGYLKEHKSESTADDVELFLRQMVDLSAIGRGILNKDTIHLQQRLGEYLKTVDKKEEGEYWMNAAYENTIKLENDDDEEFTGLRKLQDEVVTSIGTGTEIDLTDAPPERRSSLFMRKRLSNARPPRRKKSQLSSRAGGGSMREVNIPMRKAGSTRGSSAYSTVESTTKSI